MTQPTNRRLIKTLKDVDDWASSDLDVRMHRVTEYINGDGNIAFACNELLRLSMNEIGKSLKITHPNTRISAAKILGLASLKALVTDTIIIQNMANTQRVHYHNLDSIAHGLLCTIATGQLTLVSPCHHTLISGLEGGYGVRDGHRPPIGTTLRFASFVLTILADWLGKPFDLDKYALPRDPAWGQLVAHWREPDPEKLLPILLAACDVHVERIALTSWEVDSGKFEFGSTFEAVYPAEILAIINLRRSLGLPTPFINHPLMKTPYAALTLPPNTRLEPDELLASFLKAACRLNPEAVPEGLYDAVMQSFDQG